MCILTTIDSFALTCRICNYNTGTDSCVPTADRSLPCCSSLTNWRVDCKERESRSTPWNPARQRQTLVKERPDQLLVCSCVSSLLVLAALRRGRKRLSIWPHRPRWRRSPGNTL